MIGVSLLCFGGDYLMMKRNQNFDFIKIVSSLMVVCLHAPFPGNIGAAITSLNRVAVPLFFMITGYYYTHTKEQQNERKQLKKIFGLFVKANVLYLIITCILGWLYHQSVITFLLSKLNVRSILFFVFLNESPFGLHLWYLGAILYVLLIVYFFEKRWSRQKLYPAISLLLLANLALGRYAPLVLGQSLKFVWSRNFLFAGLPYFLLGDLIYTRKITMKPAQAALLALFFGCTTVVEQQVTDVFLPGGVCDHYFSTAFLAFFIFLTAVQYRCQCNHKIWHILCDFGAALYTDVYILHIGIMNFLDIAVPYLCCIVPISGVYAHIKPILIFLCTIVPAWILHRFKRRTRSMSALSKRV